MAAIQLLTAVVLNFVQFWQTTEQGIQFTMNGTAEIYSNNSIVTRTDIGTDCAALLCTTTSPDCCSSVNNQTGWYFPSGKAVPYRGKMSATKPYYRTRNNPDPSKGRHSLRSVKLHRNPNGTTTRIFRCDILDGSRNLQSLYIGIYDGDTGTPTTTALVYNDSTRSLTCTSTGGPATNVTWKKDGVLITINETYQQTQVVTNTTTGTYETVLTIAQSVSDVFGRYSCTVENIRGTASAAFNARDSTLQPTPTADDFTLQPTSTANDSTLQPLPTANDSTLQPLPTANGSPPVGAIVGAILVVVVVVCGITIGIITWRLRRRGKLSFVESVHFKSRVPQIRMPIPISKFKEHVAKMHQDGDQGFELEYNSFNKQPQASHSAADKPCNCVQNRFGNIFPYDFSRVKLREIPGEEGSDYINASFLQGYGKPKAYIAAQAPFPNQVSNFWRMIWENRLPTVVMLTRCFEGKIKCEQYWPEYINATLNPGYNLSVTLTSSLPFAEYEIRKLVLKDTSNPGETPLQVTQLHYLGWPDHGVPANAFSMVNFIRQVRKIHPPFHQHPLLVHCSAGVGRTGAFIVLDSMMQRIEAEGNVNIYEFLEKLRMQRMLMVQTESQYVFIHDALCELIICGDTEIIAPSLRMTINHLHKQAEGKVVSGFQHQFQFLEHVSHNMKEVSYAEAKACYNIAKNRYSNKLANDATRVRLRSNGVSDYINANFIDGYRKRNAYIATQGPLPSTVNDFWQMVWEYESKCIVMLCNLQEDGVDACCCYWPERKGASVTYGKLRVTVVSVDYHGDVVIRKLEVTQDKPSTETPAVKKSTALTVTHFHFQRWPEHGCPHSTSSLLVLMDTVTKVEMGARGKAITVMCSDGLGRTGAFICIHSQLERLKAEGVVDIFQSIKSTRIQRAGLIQTVEQYTLCHTVLADYVDSLETYANFEELV